MSDIGPVKLKRGHVRDDGMVFWLYDHPHQREKWVTKQKADELNARRRELVNKHYAENTEKKRAQARFYGKKHANNKRNRRLIDSFGITIHQYAEMEAAQGGVCAICKEPERTMRCGKPARLAVDHCHTTGQVRGLLCQGCNMGIGLLRDNSFVLEEAAKYIKAGPSKYLFVELIEDFVGASQ